MARDEQEEEREFLADLEARTGRDLAQWMAAITAQGFADKNETIDWLRAQGIPFARASWLERIHSNGGRPIYLHQPPKAAGEGKPLQPAKPARARHGPPDAEPARDRRSRQAAGGRQGLSAALPAARGRDPRCGARPRRHAEGQPTSRSAHPASSPPSRCTRPSCGSAWIWATGPSICRCRSPGMRGPGPAISHMVVLTDARQVNAELLNLNQSGKQASQRLKHGRSVTISRHEND